MTKNRNGKLLNSLLIPFRKVSAHDGSETLNPTMVESRLRLEKRIELALGSTPDLLQTVPKLLG